MRTFSVVVALMLVASSIRAAGQAAVANAEIGDEARSVLSTLQSQVKNLPESSKSNITSAFTHLANTDAKFKHSSVVDPVDPSAILNLDPQTLDSRQVNDAISYIQRSQQVADPTLVPSNSSSSNVTDVIDAFNSSSPLTPDELLRFNTTVAQIPRLSKSVGRLLWANSDGNQWTFAGTVFVAKANVVATACHVIESITNVANGTTTLRLDRRAVVDFSDGILPDNGQLPPGITTYRVLKVVATGSTEGCDVALLQLDNSLNIPALKISDGTSVPKRVAVLGYPQLNDLTPLVCQYAVSETTKFFCNFHQQNPNVAKVRSPGSVYISNSHNGVNVILYNSSTRSGQSGSPVIDLDTLQVVGIHYCCTGSSDVDTAIPCAEWHAQNLAWNEAIGSKALIGDAALTNFFQVGTVDTARSSADEGHHEAQGANLIARAADAGRRAQ